MPWMSIRNHTLACWHEWNDLCHIVVSCWLAAPTVHGKWHPLFDHPMPRTHPLNMWEKLMHTYPSLQKLMTHNQLSRTVTHMSADPHKSWKSWELQHSAPHWACLPSQIRVHVCFALTLPYINKPVPIQDFSVFIFRSFSNETKNFLAHRPRDLNQITSPSSVCTYNPCSLSLLTWKHEIWSLFSLICSQDQLRASQCGPRWHLLSYRKQHMKITLNSCIPLWLYLS